MTKNNKELCTFPQNYPMIDYLEWPLEDLLLCSETIETTLYHQLYSRQLDAITVISPEEAQLLIERGIKQVDELPE